MNKPFPIRLKRPLAVIGVGNAPKKQSPEPQGIPDWAERIESDLATIKDLLLKLLAK